MLRRSLNCFVGNFGAREVQKGEDDGRERSDGGGVEGDFCPMQDLKIQFIMS